MSEPNNNVPWPIWAIVSIIVALIGAWAIKQASHREPLPTTPAQVTGVSERTPSNQAGAMPQSPYVPANATAAVDVQPEPVQFAIHDALGSAQQAEMVRILIDGRHIGTLEVSGDKPFATLRATVPAPGRYSWSASARAVFLGDDGQPFTYDGSGQGIILIEENSSFTLRATYSGPTWTLTLERDGAS